MDAESGAKRGADGLENKKQKKNKKEKKEKKIKTVSLPFSPSGLPLCDGANARDS
jgi:hypothetical protein